MTNAWRQTRRMKRLAVGPSTTSGYIEWLGKRINDNIPMPSRGDNQLAEKNVRVVPSELKIIRQDFKRRNLEFEKRIEQMEEEKMSLKLDIDVQRMQNENLRKGKHKAEEDLNSLRTDYKRLRLSVRTAGLGKISEQWRQEIQEEKIKAGRWEKKFQEAQKQNKSLEKSLAESQNEGDELKVRGAELEKVVHQYRNRNVVMELQASLGRIEQMKRTVEGLEMALQNCEARIEHLEANKDHQSDQLHYLQDQVAKRDHIMGEAVVQIQGVAEHLQTLATQADILSVKYESGSDQGQKLASLLREIKVLSVRAKPYL
ncbi:protein GRIP-like [Gossypium hirsutum]|uniref:Protein GRIP-like n=1 Tax=Gossypium hirsutum TaxID=3635 RepID=A0A1U8MYV0_GOSHI|nr:protein GRIP-like [Gossypium hirsutum]